LREEATDVYYLGSPMTARLFHLDKVKRRGGTHIESRFIYQPWATGGPFYGPEVLDVSPSDPEISGAWDWKEYETNVTLTQRDLIRADSPLAVANLVVELSEIAKMDLKDKIATGIWSDGSNWKAIDGLYEICDTGVYAANYAGLSRSTYPFLKCQSDTTTTSLSVGALNTVWDNCTKGARAPQITCSTRANLTRYENLAQAQVQIQQPINAIDQTFASLGFSGGWYRNQPWLVDEHISTSGTEGNLFFFNEDYFELIVNENGDFVVGDFQQPVNQFSITSLTYVALNLICTNPQLQGKFTALAA